MMGENNSPQRWVWVKWRGESYAIDWDLYMTPLEDKK